MARKQGHKRREPQPKNSTSTRKSPEFNNFLKTAKSGDRFTYMVGRTAVDPQNPEVRLPAAQEAFEAYEAGFVYLVQRRIPDSNGHFNYIAEKR
jgi:hypothetical protein